MKQLKQNYPIPKKSLCDTNKPFCSFRTEYESTAEVLGKYPLEKTTTNTALNDIVLILVSRLYSGDLDQLIQTRAYDSNEWLVIIVTIIFTLLQLDKFFGRFYHGDFGPKNILYQLNDDKKYSRYIYKEYTIDIPNDLPVIKIWDFDTCTVPEEFFRENPEITDYFTYIKNENLGETEKLLPFINEKTENPNDVFLLFSKIKEDHPDFFKTIETYINPNIYRNYKTNTEACEKFLTLSIDSIISKHKSMRDVLITDIFII